jgi:hypothetical protein
MDAIASGVIPAKAFPVDNVHVFDEETISETIINDPDICDLLTVAIKVIDWIDKAF